MKFEETSSLLIKEIFELLLSLSGAHLNITVELPIGSDEGALKQLKQLGFKPYSH